MINYSTYENALKEYANNHNILIVTDDNLYKYYHNVLQNYDAIVLESGEQSKSIENALHIIDELIDVNANKDYILVGIGGGVICDLTAFTASIYKRGIPHILIPTSLLAMADVAYGFKTAINYRNIKNIIGTFKEPEAIIIDTSFLNTLPDVHFRNGFAEIIKTAAIGSEYLLNLINDNTYNVDEVIKLTLEFKQKIVLQDKYDTGIRHILNFGHTFGHAIEAQFGILHGFAVAYGMRIALKLSADMPENKKNLIDTTISKIVKIDENSFDFDQLEKNLLNDKKNSSKIKIILLKNIGNPYIAEFSLEKIKRDYNDLCFNRNDR